MLITKQTFTNYGNCERSQPLVDYMFSIKPEWSYDEFVSYVVDNLGKPPLFITPELLESFAYDPLDYIGKNEQLEGILGLKNCECVSRSKYVENSSNIYWATNIRNSRYICGNTGGRSYNVDNCFFCHTVSNIKNMIFCNDTHNMMDKYAICNRIVTEERFNEVKKQLLDLLDTDPNPSEVEQFLQSLNEYGKHCNMPIAEFFKYAGKKNRPTKKKSVE